jgi:hypothetical protein
MPDSCPYCGAPHPDAFRFCPETGRPLREGSAPPAAASRPPRWEYRDLTIPLHIRRPRGELTDGAVADAGHAPERQTADARIRAELERWGREGWEATGPTDIASLLATGRVATSVEQETRGEQFNRWRSAVVRVRRQVVD